MTWQTDGDWKDWFEITGADGIDFVPLFYTGKGPIYASFTKEEFFETNSYPKTNYKFWKMRNGNKYYIELTSAPEPEEKIL